MSDINKNICVSFSKDEMPRYVRDSLSLNLCRLFFKVNFIIEGEKITANYNINGYRPTNNILEYETENVFNIIIELVKKMWQCENHYIFCDEYEISDKYLYINKDSSDVKMVYMPADDTCTGPERLVKLIGQFKNKVDDEGKEYIEAAIQYISNNQFSYRTLIHYLEGLYKEVYLCEVK